MKIHLWGTDFRRSTAEMRQKLFAGEAERQKFLRRLLEMGFDDLVYLYTCNRVEFYTTAKDYFCDTRRLWQGLLGELGLAPDDYYRGYHLEGKSALRHVLRVAGSLESLVVGEPQILGQLKEAVRFTKEQGFPLSGTLEKCFFLSFETAKLIRNQTAIGEKPVSVASLGMQHLEAREASHPLQRAVVVGRSAISVLVVQWILKHRPDVEIFWANRTVSALAEFPESQKTRVLPLSDLLGSPPAFSHLFTATSSANPLFGDEFFGKVAGTPLVFDFAQPPDVSREGLRASTTVIGLEDLRTEAKQNSDLRAEAVLEAEGIIESALRAYFQQQKEAPLLKDFSAIEPLVFEELSTACQAISGDLPTDVQPKVKLWAEKLVKRNLHHSREHLRHVLRQVSEPEDSVPV